MTKINIAIDGYSSCGKSTLAKQLAKEFGYAYVDSGAMYRAVSLYALRHDWVNEKSVDQEALIHALPEIKIDFKVTENGLTRTVLNDEDVEDEIRSMEVSQVVSAVSTIEEVRKHLVKKQQALGVEKGVVMDGRDIGTVVFPDAELKIFMRADPEVRAKRRYEELLAKGLEVSLEEVVSNIRKRDHQDENRAHDPLRIADDAIVLDNTDLSQNEQFDRAKEFVVERIGHST